MPQCVDEEVEQHALYLVRCEPCDRCGVDFGVERDVTLCRLGSDAAKTGRDDLVEVGGVQLECECAGIDPGQLEEVVDEQAQAPYLVAERR